MHGVLITLQGAWVEEVHQSFADWITQVVRVYRGLPGVELEYTVGPIPIMCVFTMRVDPVGRTVLYWQCRDGVGKEIISRFTSNITSDQIWYTN